MNFLTLFFQFLRGNDTVRELLRLLAISLLTALLALGIFYLFRRKQPVAAPDSGLIRNVLESQRRADSATALLSTWQYQRRIDSLTYLLRKRNELDSMRANAGLSDLDAMDRINGAIRAQKNPR